MKIIFPLLLCAIISSCKTSQSTSLVELEKYAMPDPIEDSVLHALQQQYDLVIASATENYAWVRNVNYILLCKQGNDWAGYTYYKNNMPPGDKKNYIPFTLTSTGVDYKACESLLAYMLENKVWNIKGDSEKGFCGNNAQCVINDAATKRLWMITKTKFIAPSYYAPDFYENCCPGNEERKLFLTITGKIESMIAVKGAEM